MKKINNKGFTLVEILAVIVIIAIIGIIAVPSIIGTINNGKQASYDILVEDITIAGKQLFEEIDYVGTTLYHYEISGKTEDIIVIKDDVPNDSKTKITVKLQSLVSNGFLTGTENSNKSSTGNNNDKIIVNPKNDQDIGDCQIVITKTVDSNFNTSYEITNNSTSNEFCPKDTEYIEVLN